MDEELDTWLAAFPRIDRLPFEIRWPSLYAVVDLYDRFDPADPGSWERSRDYLVYEWFVDKRTSRPRTLPIGEAMAARPHDATIEVAISDFLRPARGRAVGFMGGHGVSRIDPDYERVAVMARDLKRSGFMVVTGGGPGLMEAANLGAFLALFGDDQMAATLAILRDAPTSGDKRSADWLRVAATARGRLLGDWRAEVSKAGESLGIPTWLYGHEPPNLFCSHVGK